MRKRWCTSKKPCILNGIDDVASQPDLVSRCLLMELPTITLRRTEEDLNSYTYACHTLGLNSHLQQRLTQPVHAVGLDQERGTQCMRLGRNGPVACRKYNFQAVAVGSSTPYQFQP